MATDTVRDGFIAEHEAFRDALATVHKDGRRKWVYARQPSGRFYRARTLLSWFLLAFLFAAPFVTFRGHPLVLFDFLERRFVVFGLVFWPQDFYLVVLVALTVLVTLALSTTAVGRIWCGWLCPQTVFMEMLFRKIEYLIDGSAAEQLRRDRAPMSFDTLWRRVIKHGIFFGLSFAIANVFLAYIIGRDDWWAIVTDPPLAHLTGLVTITIFSLVFYGVFARFREQACTLACPYGRVMSALIDRQTLTVTYDSVRGEPRRTLRQAAADPSVQPGDCVDCGQCVTVCPTGIDIRNGIQLECVNCAACIDACDDVMRRLKRPTGLIRITSYEAVHSGRARWATARVKAYAAVWVVLVLAVGTLMARRPDLDVLVLRQPGTMYTVVNDGAIANFYNVQVVNRTGQAHAIAFRVVAPAGATLTPLGSFDRIDANQLINGRLIVSVPREALTGANTAVILDVTADGIPSRTVTTSLVGPVPTAKEGAK